MKKTQTTYFHAKNPSFYIAKNEEVEDNISIYEGIEPCSGIVRHWGSKESIIKELKAIIAVLEKWG